MKIHHDYNHCITIEIFCDFEHLQNFANKFQFTVFGYAGALLHDQSNLSLDVYVYDLDTDSIDRLLLLVIILI